MTYTLYLECQMQMLLLSLEVKSYLLRSPRLASRPYREDGS